MKTLIVIDQEQVEEKLRHQHLYTTVLHETTLDLMNRLELTDLLKAILARVGVLMDTSHGYLALVEAAEYGMVIKVGMGIFNELIGYPLKLDEDLVRKALQTNQPLAILTVEEYPTWSERLIDSNFSAIHTVITVPFKSGPQILGVISLAYLEENRVFGDEEILLLNWLAELASIAVDNAQLYVLTKQELAERKRTEGVLRESERRFREMLENIQLLAIGVDVQGNIMFCNKYFLSLTGWRREEVLGQNWFEIFLPAEYQAEMRQAFHKAILSHTLPAHVEKEIQTRRGKRRLISWSSTFLHDLQGNIIGLTSIGEDITTRRHTEEKIRYLAYYDALTDLPNRELLKDRLTLALAHAHRNGQMLAVIFLDLDHFKAINDTLGHSAGDQLLQEVAKRLLSCLREGDTIARMGGDEFTLLLPQISQPEDATVVARKILEALSPSFQLEGHDLHITCSMGIALYPNDGQDAQALLKSADTALYRAKASGRNNYHFHTSTMNAKAFERLILENGLRRSLSQGEFMIYYQPQISLHSKQIVGMEALLRWQHPELGLIPPIKFIPLAEETGLIVSIGEWLLYSVCAQNKIWQDTGFPPLRVAVNLSARSFKQQNLLETIKRVLRETRLDPNYLELELTESTLMENAEATIKTLQELKAMGIHLSIDDFGTGYSSLSYLKRFPIDTLKIDQSFVQDILIDSEDISIATLIIIIAHSLKLKVIAEGVETQEQLIFLRSQGCDEVQGYLFSQPLPVEAFTQFLREGENLIKRFF